MSRNTIYLPEYATKAYLEYSMAVVTDRALPFVQDGQKPVQVRILYAMKTLGLTHPAKPVKCARVVGDVLGKYHPHGDSSAYGALVRMAQPFSLRYPLIIGQGNFGSRDGDSAAAMRYTEASLSPIAQLLLDEVDKGTIDFVPNYDGSTKEPSILPARLPMLLLNGSSGIAVGMANDIPPHNLKEIANAALHLIEHPDASLRDLMAHVKGPDFPDGGILISPIEDIESAYEKGRGSVKLRANYVKESLARGQWKIVITELPYQVGAKKILEEIEELSNPKVPVGKKTLTPLQLQLKQVTLSLIENATDESDKSNPIRLVITPASSKVDEQQLLDFLYANTSLQVNITINNTVIGLDGNPATKSLFSMLDEWLSFRKITLTRRFQTEMAQLQARLHIIQGRIVVFLNLDEVISVIKEAESPLQSLMASFDLSEIQANDILEMKLRQLNNLEGIKLEKERDQLEKEIARIQKILNTKALFDKELSSEIIFDRDKYGDERRTQIKSMPKQDLVKTVAAPTLRVDDLDVVLSKNGWLKGYKPNAEALFKTGDGLFSRVSYKANNLLFAITNTGRVYTLNPSDLVGVKGDGIPIATLCVLSKGESIAHLLAVEAEQPVLMASGSGYGFLCTAKNMQSKQKAGKQFVDCAGFDMLAPVLAPQDLSNYLVVGQSGTDRKAFPAQELAYRESGGKGLMLFSAQNSVTSLELIENSSESLLTEAIRQKQKTLSNKFIGKRGRSL